MIFFFRFRLGKRKGGGQEDGSIGFFVCPSDDNATVIIFGYFNIDLSRRIPCACIHMYLYIYVYIQNLFPKENVNNIKEYVC